MPFNNPPTLKAQARVAAAAVAPALGELATQRSHPRLESSRIGFAAPGVETGWAVFGEAPSRHLTLWFPSPRGLFTTLVSGKARAALPLGDLRLLGALRHLPALGAELTALTAPDGGLGESSGEQLLATSLLLHTMLPNALAALGSTDTASQALTTSHVPFTFAMGVRDGAAGWISRTVSHWTCGRGWPAQRATASLEFASTRIAAAALAQRSDELAAIAAGEIVVNGRVPLADAMAQMLGRAGDVLRGARRSM